ncbi:MAG: AAA family ATPase [Myxococcota bacterium]
MERTLGDVVRRSLEERVVGRDPEFDVLVGHLNAAAEAPRVVTVVGSAGTGKTTLALLLRSRAEAEGRQVVWVSGEAGAPATMRRTLEEEVPQLGRGAKADLLVIDGFERVVGIESWLFQAVLPKAGARLLVVMTSRERLSARFRSDVGLAPLLHELELGTLTSEQSTKVLHDAAIPPADHATIVAFTGGLPLALALVIDRYRFDDDYHFTAREPGEVVAVLMQELLRDIDDTRTREAIDALSIVPVADRELLQRMLGDAQGTEAYALLRKLSFVREDAGTLQPHDWARSAAFSDLATRRPNELGRLADRAVSELVERANFASPARTRELILQALMTRRDRPEVQAVGLSVVDQTTLRRLAPDDDKVIEASLEAFEAPASVDEFRRWRADHPEGFFVVCDLAGAVVGFIGHLPVGNVGVGRKGDPLMDACASMSARIPGADRDGVHCFRWFYSLETHMAPSPSLGAVMLSGPLVVASAETIPRFSFFVVPPAWAGQAERMLVAPFGGPNVEVFGRTYQPFLLDLSLATDDWSHPGEVMRASLRGMAERLLEPSAALDRASFEAAVKDAMASLHEPAALERTALTRAHSVPEPRDASAIRSYLQDAVAAMADRPRQKDWADVLHRTYVEPAVKQRAAAIELGLPFGTYRYRLRRALATLADELWASEQKAR